MLLWDLPLRVFHLLLVGATAAVFASGTAGGLWLPWHGLVGDFIAALLVFRLVWGFIGSTYSRFASFLPTPARWRSFLRAKGAVVGHSPPAALSVLAMLSLILAAAVSGLLAHDDELDFHAPFYALVTASASDLATSWHRRLTDAVGVFVLFHMAAIAYYRLGKSRDLLTPMLTGRLPGAAGGRPAQGGGGCRAGIAVAAAALAFWLLAGLIPGWLADEFFSFPGG